MKKFEQVEYVVQVGDQECRGYFQVMSSETIGHTFAERFAEKGEPFHFIEGHKFVRCELTTLDGFEVKAIIQTDDIEPDAYVRLDGARPTGFPLYTEIWLTPEQATTAKIFK